MPSSLALPPLWWGSYGKTSWAPDISFHNGRYWLYYAVSQFGSQDSAIGLATSFTGELGSWADQGIVFSSQSGDDFNAIDPNLVVDAQGRWWLAFGSFWNGIFMMRLDPDTGKLDSSEPALVPLARRPVAANPIEAPFVFRRGRYYYLFASFGHCCEGRDSDYNVRVGRSISPVGPYVDDKGTRMLDGGGKLVLAAHGRVRAPGGKASSTTAPATAIYSSITILIPAAMRDPSWASTSSAGMQTAGRMRSERSALRRRDRQTPAWTRVTARPAPG